MAAKVTTFLKGAAFAALVFAALFVGIFFALATYKLNILTNKIEISVDNVNKALIEINKPKTGILAQVYDITYNARLTIDNVNKTAIDERMYFEKIQPMEIDKVNDILDNFDKTIVSSNININTIGTSLNSAISYITKDSNQLNSLLLESTETLRTANATLNNPNIVSTLSNFNKTSAHIETATVSLNTTLGNIEYMSSDTKDTWHKFLHPTWPRRIWSLITGSGVKAAPYLLK